MNPVSRFVRWAVCLPIRGYRKFLSPCLGKHCRFVPTCSEYALCAIRTHGVLKGGILTVWRLCRCNPLGRWGFDPIPEKGQWTNPRRVLYPRR